MMNDHQQLARFGETGDNAVFAEVVRRHAPMVLATARRIVRDPALAEEVAQDAFCLLARKARGFPESAPLSGWLHRTAWHLAMRTLRRELRRQAREQHAAAMPTPDSDPDSLWERIAPHLDQALESLAVADRNAVLWRFFERQPAREIAARLGVSEEAARMRVSRAVDKLRDLLRRRGVSCSSSALVALLTANAVESVSAGVIHSISSAAGAAAGSVSPTTLTLKLLTLMAQIKVKTALIGGAALLLALLVRQQLREPDSGAAGLAKAGSSNGQPARAASELRPPGFRARAGAPADPVEAAEMAALERLKEILYSTDSDVGLPPQGAYQAVRDSGSKRRAALDLMLEAFRSSDRRAQERAAASLQFFRESAAELMPEILAAWKTSTNPALISCLAMSTYSLQPGPGNMAAVVEALKTNPAAAGGFESWFGSYLHDKANDPARAVAALLPLLESPSDDQRRNAALILARTEARNDPRLVSALLPAIEKSVSGGDGSNVSNEIASIEALRLIGAPARPAAQALLDYGERMPGMKDLVLNTLASIAPDLRSEIPELDQKLSAREAAAVLEEQAKRGQVGVDGLLASLDNQEARAKAIARLGAMGPEAATALPRLRAILQAGDSAPGSDANNFLYDVANVIRKLDPKAPTYYRPEDLQMAFMEAAGQLKGVLGESSPGLRESAESRMFSNRPFDRGEILGWVEKFNAVSAEVGANFVRQIRRSPSMGQLEATDPALAKALGN